jgi:acyl-coenzyme A synthetase/AMP-(fatty) acid ligase
MSFFLEGLARHARERGDQPALWSRGEDLRLRFADLASWCEELARLIGVEEGGPPIGVATGNCAAFCALFLALRRLGAAFVGIDGSLGYDQKLDLCRRLGLSRLIHRHGEAAGAGASQIGYNLYLERLDLQPAPAPAGTALIKLTSGSTGDPLGACFDDESLEAGIGQIAAAMEITAADRVLMAIPLSHSYGFDNGVLSLFALGTPLVLEPSFYPAAISRALRESEATFLPLVPPLVRGIAQPPAGGAGVWSGLALRRVICAGGTLVPAAAEQFLATTGRPVHNFFGSTETGGISFEREPLDPAALGTVGHPLPGVRIELDAEGRVAIHSPANTIGHFGRGEARGGAGRGRPISTGDLATFTPEGRLKLLGRSADILNIGGKKVAAAEIENALRALPGVREAAVVGVEDAVRGDRSVAFLVADSWPLDLSPLQAIHAPRELHRLDSLPYTERGKVDRGLLRSLAGRPRA